MGSCTVSDILYDEKSARPFTVNFQNGKVNQSTEGLFTCKLFERNGKFVPTVATNKLVYKAEIDRDDEVCHSFLAVINKKTNKVRLISTDNVTLGTHTFDKENGLDTTISAANDKQQSLIDLNKKFGSKKARRATEQMERLKMEVDNVREELEQTVADIVVKEEDMVIPSEDGASLYKPPINKDASTLEEVYAINTLIPDEISESLKKEAALLLEKKDGELELTDYAKSIFLRVKESTSSNKRKIKTCKVILFMDNLIKLTVSTVKTITLKRFCLCSYSPVVNDYILDNFTVNSANSRYRPNSMRDKSICHIIILATILNNYSVNIEELAIVFKIGVKKLQEFCKVLYLSPGKDKATERTLKLPLPTVSNFRSPVKRKK